MRSIPVHWVDHLVRHHIIMHFAVVFQWILATPESCRTHMTHLLKLGYIQYFTTPMFVVEITTNVYSECCPTNRFLQSLLENSKSQHSKIRNPQWPTWLSCWSVFCFLETSQTLPWLRCPLPLAPNRAKQSRTKCYTIWEFSVIPTCSNNLVYVGHKQGSIPSAIVLQKRRSWSQIN